MINRVKEVRTKAGMSQIQLAEAAGVARQTIVALESGKNSDEVRLGTLKKVSVALGKSIDELFF